MKKISSLMAAACSLSVLAHAEIPSWDGSLYDYGLNPPVLCPVQDCGTFGVWGEFLWMRAIQDDTYAYSIQNFTSDTQEINDYKRVKFDPDWEAGWRVGALYSFPCDGWGIEGYWTYYYDKSSKRSPEGSLAIGTGSEYNGSFIDLPFHVNTQLIGTLPTTSTLTSAVDSSFKVRFNEVDVQLVRKFFVGPAVVLKPYIGFRGLFIEESVNTTATQNLATVTTGTFDYNQSLKLDSSAYGGKGGFEITFDLCYGLQLFGDMSATIAWTHYKNHYNFSYSAEDDVPVLIDQIITNQESFDALRYHADFVGGIQWVCDYDCHQNEFFVRVGWEHHIFLSQNTNNLKYDLLAIPNAQAADAFFSTGGGDLSLYGLSVKAGLTF